MPTFVTSKARENILSRIRKNLGDYQSPIPFSEAENVHTPFYTSDAVSIEEQFADAFIQLGGKFMFCDSLRDAVENIAFLSDAMEWSQLLCSDNKILIQLNNYKAGLASNANDLPEAANACITTCEALIARTGSILVSSQQNLGRTSTVYYPTHIVVAYIDEVVGDVDEAINVMKKKYKEALPSFMSIATGPSRTADIEKTLVVGVHGPAEVYCFLINEESGSFYI